MEAFACTIDMSRDDLLILAKKRPEKGVDSLETIPCDDNVLIITKVLKVLKRPSDIVLCRTVNRGVVRLQLDKQHEGKVIVTYLGDRKNVNL